MEDSRRSWGNTGLTVTATFLWECMIGPCDAVDVALDGALSSLGFYALCFGTTAPFYFLPSIIDMIPVKDQALQHVPSQL